MLRLALSALCLSLCAPLVACGPIEYVNEVTRAASSELDAAKAEREKVRVIAEGQRHGETSLIRRNHLGLDLRLPGTGNGIVKDNAYDGAFKDGFGTTTLALFCFFTV